MSGNPVKPAPAAGSMSGGRGMDQEDPVPKNQDDLEEEGNTEVDMAVRPGEARLDTDQA